jgi:hypothetical protein
MENSIFAAEAAEALATTTFFQRYVMEKWGKKLYLGDEHRQGWEGAAPFFLFWCDVCEHHAKDYPHGEVENRHLLCSHCGARHDFVPWWAGLASS